MPASRRESMSWCASHRGHPGWYRSSLRMQGKIVVVALTFDHIPLRTRRDRSNFLPPRVFLRLDDGTASSRPSPGSKLEGRGGRCQARSPNVARYEAPSRYPLSSSGEQRTGISARWNEESSSLKGAGMVDGRDPKDLPPIDLLAES